MDKSKIRAIVKENLLETISILNEHLQGKNINKIEETLNRISAGSELPHWYPNLKKNGTFPNMDGKSIGSVIEMLFVCVLENYTLKKKYSKNLSINPAKGVDLPDLDLGIKSPSENFCTSEPFFNAYERLLGSEYDCLVLLTDYQQAKKKPPIKVKIIKYEYLEKSEIADKNLCAIGLKHRRFLIEKNETLAKKFFKFLAHVNQGDWVARQILKLYQVLQEEDQVHSLIEAIEKDFETTNKRNQQQKRELVPRTALNKIKELALKRPYYEAIINLGDDWTIENLKEFARIPNDNEWQRLKAASLNGKISISYALQWRYNFGSLFRN